jgi:hypothetical protein
VKALTVQQPWAWAIIHGGKDVENRTQAWSYRGPLAIHAGTRWSERGAWSPLMQAALAKPQDTGSLLAYLERGAFIGVVDLVAVHVAGTGCCDSDWGEQQYDEHGGRTRRDIVHLVLERPRPLPEPIPCRGSLGLWTPPADVLEQLQAVVR